MVVLSYDKAKRTLVMMAIYLIIASFVIKGVGGILNYNLLGMTDSLLNGQGLSFSLPEINLPTFNMDTFSFDILRNIVNEKIHEFVDVIFPTAMGVIDIGLVQAGKIQPLLWKRKLV